MQDLEGSAQIMHLGEFPQRTQELTTLYELVVGAAQLSTQLVCLCLGSFSSQVVLMQSLVS